MAASIRQAVQIVSVRANVIIKRDYRQIRLSKLSGIFGGPNQSCSFSWSRNTIRLLRVPRTGFQIHRGYAKAVGVVAGMGIGGTGWYLWDLFERAQPVVLAGAASRPIHNASRMIRNSTDETGLNLTLYQYQTCPFCCKVRAYLDYRGFSYDVVEVNSLWRSQTRWSKYKKVPILVIHGQGEDGFLQLNDSSVIISSLETFLKDKTLPVEKILTYYPSIESQNEKGKKIIEFPNRYFIMYGDRPQQNSAVEEKSFREERKWRGWTDDVLVHVLSPNIYKTPKEALQSFRYFSYVGEWEKHFNSFERLSVIYVGAGAMYLLGKMLKKKYKLKEDVRESLYDAAREWTKGIGKSRNFMGGDQPNLADLSVYGVLHAIEGCDAFEDMLNNTKIKKWYYQTKGAIEMNAGVRVEDTNLGSQQLIAAMSAAE